MLRLEARGRASLVMSIASPLAALALTALCGALLFSALGKDALQGLALFFIEPLSSAYRLSELAMKAVPLTLIGLGLAVCFRSNVWNIGAEGQFILGAIASGYVAMKATPESPRAIVLLILAAGVLGGMAWAAIVALLRERFNANEILSSLMLVYVADMLLAYLVYGPWKDPQGFNFPKTVIFAAPTQVPLVFEGLRVNAGVYLALGALVAVWLFLFRSFAGFAQQVGGVAPAAARYAGFSAAGASYLAFLVSGGLAGLAGALEAAGPLGQLTPHVSVGYGFAAIIVAFVGRLHPVGVLFAAILMSMFYIGGELAQSRLALPKSVTGMFQGLLLFWLLACDSLIAYRVVWRQS